MVESLRQLLRGGSSAALGRVWALLEPLSELDVDFFGPRGRVVVRDGVCEGFVAVAQCRRHWTEALLTVGRAELQLLRDGGRRPLLRLALGSVLSVKPLPPAQGPVPELAVLQVETLGRVLYLLLASDAIRDRWMEAFARLLGRGVLNSPFDRHHPHLINHLT